jgi:hypothetical protein
MNFFDILLILDTRQDIQLGNSSKFPMEHPEKITTDWKVLQIEYIRYTYRVFVPSGMCDSDLDGRKVLDNFLSAANRLVGWWVKVHWSVIES